MKNLNLLIATAAACLVAGCSSTNSNAPMTHAAFTAAVTLGEQFALEKYPEAIPHVRVATTVICAAANSTNIQPAQIVAALEDAGVTNAQAKVVINIGIALYNVVFSSYGSNWINNQPELKLYAHDLCNGMEAGLPPLTPTPIAARKQLPPHL